MTSIRVHLLHRIAIGVCVMAIAILSVPGCQPPFLPILGGAAIHRVKEVHRVRIGNLREEDAWVNDYSVYVIEIDAADAAYLEYVKECKEVVRHALVLLFMPRRASVPPPPTCRLMLTGVARDGLCIDLFISGQEVPDANGFALFVTVATAEFDIDVDFSTLKLGSSLPYR
ncbi:MAG: hypothetical protein IT440_07695 [Phycisphaeraceae bacterium]|nr:hypothetical protein [Phycisphaeraceae bacterium]